jgi:hypothetical protein
VGRLGRRARQATPPQGVEAQLAQLVRSSQLLTEAVAGMPSAQTPAVKNGHQGVEEAPIGVTKRWLRAAKAMAGDFQNILGLLTILGVVFYGIFALAYHRYYDELGISPEEVGLSYGTVVWRAALATAILLAMFTPLIVFFTIPP